MVLLFYILVLAQILLGIYSLWHGFRWLLAMRRESVSQAGFYAPIAAVLCPCKGKEQGLEENLLALTKFDYPNYEIYFSVASATDPALEAIERLKAASARPVHIVVAGPPQDCGEKVFNLLRTVESLPSHIEVLVFTDSDARHTRDWLRKLVAPLGNTHIGAVTGYRWIIPSGATPALAFPSALASAWNAAVATLLGPRAENFCWGGATAIRRRTFDTAQVPDYWKGALSDDWALTRALEHARLPIVFSPQCLAATLHPWTWPSLLEFTNRQILITRIYAFKRWALGAMAHLGYALTLIYAALVILVELVAGDTWMQLALIAFVIPLLAAMKAAVRAVAVQEMMPQWKGPLEKASWICIALAPLVPFLFSWNFIASLFTNRLRWRGVRYQLVSPAVTHVLRP